MESPAEVTNVAVLTDHTEIVNQNDVNASVVLLPIGEPPAIRRDSHNVAAPRGVQPNARTWQGLTITSWRERLVSHGRRSLPASLL